VLALLRTYDTICLEDVRVDNRIRNQRLAKSISDAGWARFRTILACKAAWVGKRATHIHQPGLCGLWGAGAQEFGRAHTRLPHLRAGPGPR
jgi:hypothetical protein